MRFNILPLLTDIADTEAVTEIIEATSDATDLMNSTMTFGERLKMGLEVTLFGMAVVFAVLILLWGILEVFRVIFYELPKKKAAEAEVKTTETAEPAPAPIEAAETVVEEESETDDAELVAAITAAISVVMDKPQTSFRVVSFRRTATK